MEETSCPQSFGPPACEPCNADCHEQCKGCRGCGCEYSARWAAAQGPVLPKPEAYR
jgi:hypothetical protein